MYDMGFERAAEVQDSRIASRIKHEINDAWLDAPELKDEPVFERTWSR